MNEHLVRVRRWLALAYVVVFALILFLFGSAVLWVSTREMIAQLDESLGEAVDALERAIVEADPAGDDGLAGAVESLRIPSRDLYAFDATGRLLHDGAAPTWLPALVSGFSDASRFLTVEGPDDLEVEWRVHGRPLQLPRAEPVIGVVVADFLEVEDRYPGLVGAFAVAALAALLLVAAGGSWLARRSVAPAEHAFRQLRRFTADAAHELRTPVSVIQARSEGALQRERGPADYRAALEGVLVETRRVSDTLDKLLTLARADAGDWPIERRDVYLDDVVSDLSGTMGALAAQRGVELTVSTEEECPVRGDPSLLSQLVTILVDNAIAFTEPDGRVQVSAVRKQGRSVLEVSDTGIGMSREETARAFDRFYRADEARERGGAGLGLAIARWIVREHTAELELDSEPGRGTTVRVTFTDVGVPGRS